MKRIDDLVRKNVKSLIPYSCARDEYEGTEGTFLDANESPFGPLNRYPDPGHKDLRTAIAAQKGIPYENIFLGNGSDEIIDLCFRIFCNPGSDRAMIFTPTYGMYQVSAAVNDIEVIKVPLDESFDIDLDAASPYLKDTGLKLVFICSPNNPTGNSMDHEKIEFIIRNFTGIVVLDEAYSDFSSLPSFSGMTNKYENLIVMQTFSKALGLAAARIGMAFAGTQILKYFFMMKPPYNISTINQEAALVRLRDSSSVNIQKDTIIAERKRLVEKLEALPVVEKVFPSDSNFLLVRVKDADAIYNSLITKHIIVRNKSREIEGCLRITAGIRSENDRLLNELEQITL